MKTKISWMGVILLAAAALVWRWPAHREEAEEPSAVRPVKAAIVRLSGELPDILYSGKVNATDSRKLAFKQAGRIERIPVSKGQVVKKGEALAWLESTDFSNRVVQAEAAAERDRLSFVRIREAAKKNAVSREELSRAESQLKTSEASLKLAQKALEETVLYAPFDGKIADVPATELDMVDPSVWILTVQNTDHLDIEVSVPETNVIRLHEIRCASSNASCTVVFDSCPERSYPAVFKEHTATADADNQTYKATYMVAQPEDLFILPGMSATIRLSGLELADGGRGAYAIVPESAIGADADGGSFVWLLKRTDAAEEYVAQKRPVRIAERSSRGTYIEEGLSGGELIATAGVTVISEGLKVRILK